MNNTFSITIIVLCTILLIGKMSLSLHEYARIKNARHCSDFASWEESTQAFERDANKFHPKLSRLDGDGDGIVCEIMIK